MLVQAGDFVLPKAHPISGDVVAGGDEVEGADCDVCILGGFGDEGGEEAGCVVFGAMGGETSALLLLWKLSGRGWGKPELIETVCSCSVD